MLTFDQIQSAIDSNFRSETVTVKSFGGEIRLRELSVPAKGKLQLRYADEDGNIAMEDDEQIEFFVDLIALSIVQPPNMDTPRGRQAIRSLTLEELRELADKCIELSAMRPDDASDDKKKD